MNLKLLSKTLSQATLVIILGIITSPESAQATRSISQKGVGVEVAKPTLLLGGNIQETILTDNSLTNISNESEISSGIVIASQENIDFVSQNESTPVGTEIDDYENAESSIEIDSISIPIAVETSKDKTLQNSIVIPVVPAVTENTMAHKQESNPVVTLENLENHKFITGKSVSKEQTLVPQQVKMIQPDSKRQKSSNKDLVSSVPIQIQYYDPTTSPSVESLISPDLPNINSPDAYLPEASNSFKGYIWPAKGVFTSGYGWRWGRMHRGIDIAAPVGTPIVAAADGEVISAGWNSGGYGNLVKIKHFNGSISLYAHNSKILVRKGEWVKQGQQIAKMGSTGFSTGPHLHFEIHVKGKKAVNPIALLPKK